MKKKIYYFDNREDFDEQIRRIDISVPLRSQGRKTEHTEKYSIVSFLQNFVNDNLLSFPLKLIHQDRPDFVLESSDNKIGIEFTESIPEQLARAMALSEEYFPNGKLEPEFFGWSAPERNNTEILAILSNSQKRLIGKGYVGKSIEEEWMRGILGCIINKTKKLDNLDFDKFRDNWLLIYDNQTKSFLDKEYISNRIQPLLADYWEEKRRFKSIFIESGKYFYCIKQNLFLIKENILIKQ